jgi:hypothetical protein
MTAESKKMSPVAFVLNVLMTTLFFPALILLLAGNWGWVEGWIFALWLVVMILFNLIYLYWKDPALLAERTKAPGSGNQKSWDMVLIIFILVLAVLWLIVLPLDAERFYGSPAFPLWLKILGGVALIPALYLIERATIDNTYLSARVRIQIERKQRVITAGVYGLIISLIGLLALTGRIIGEEKCWSRNCKATKSIRKR